MPTAAAEPFGTLHDRAVYLPDAEAVVAADLHLGKVAASAVDAPLDAGPDMVARLGRLVDRFEPDTVVLAGDVLHAFGFVPRSAHDAIDALVDRLSGAAVTLGVVAGNHDTQLAEVDGIEPHEAVELDDGTVVCHGHERPTATGRRYVIGHDHPVIEIDGRRRPCYLYGEAMDDGRDVLCLPAFNPAVRGTAVNAWDEGDPLSPFLANIDRFRPMVWDEDAEETLVFPPLAALRRYL